VWTGTVALELEKHVAASMFMVDNGRPVGTHLNGKAIPVQNWTGPAFSRRLRFPDFKTNGT
jgi:hypothetical protein